MRTALHVQRCSVDQPQRQLMQQSTLPHGRICKEQVVLPEPIYVCRNRRTWNSFFAAVCSNRETILASNNSILRCIYRNELANWTGLRQKHHLLDFKLTRGTTFWPFNFRIFHKDLSLLLGATVQSRSPGISRSHQKSAGTSRGAISHPDPCAEMQQPRTTWKRRDNLDQNHFIRRRLGGCPGCPSSTAASVKTEASWNAADKGLPKGKMRCAGLNTSKQQSRRNQRKMLD